MKSRVFVNVAQMIDYRASTFDELLRIAILEFNGKPKVHEAHCEINRQELPVDFAATLDNYAEAVQAHFAARLNGPTVYVSPSGRGEYEQATSEFALDKKYVEEIQGALADWQSATTGTDYCNILSYLRYNPEPAGINHTVTDSGVPKSNYRMEEVQ